MLIPLPNFQHYETFDDEESSGSDDDEIRNTDIEKHFNEPLGSSVEMKNNRIPEMQTSTFHHSSPAIPCEEFSSRSTFARAPYQIDDIETAYNNCLKSPISSEYYNHHSPAAIGVSECKSCSRNDDIHTNNYNYAHFNQSNEMVVDHQPDLRAKLRAHLTSILSTILVRAFLL